jgi:hypothetical protein
MTEQQLPPAVTVLQYDNTIDDDVSAVRQLVFGHLLSIAAPIVQHYHSDLYHDAIWLSRHLSGPSMTFYWSVDDCGTQIGTDAIGHNRREAYRVTVAIEGYRAVLTMERIEK